MTLNELFDIYIEDVDMINQVTTTDSIKYRYKSHLKPVFGNIELEAIDPKSIKKFQKDMVEGVYRSRSGDVFSVSYINLIVELLKRLIKYSVLMNYFTPAVEQSRGLKRIHALVDKEKHKKRQIIWSIGDFNRFISHVDEEKFYVLFNVFFYTGLRKGEALSLMWKDIDLVEQTITINSTACRVRGRGQIVKEPKSFSSHRIIYINDSLNEMLLNYYLNKKTEYSCNINHHFVFGDTKMLSYSTLDRFFIKYKELSNVSNMNLHGFRHSHATMMLEITNDVYNVSKRLGHENIEITDTYLHVNNKIQREMAQKIEDVIKSEEKNKIEDYLYDLKVSLKMQMTKGSYSTEDIRKLKNIYDCISGL